MTANGPETETEIIEKVLIWLRERLPPGWSVNGPDFETEVDYEAARLDLTASIQAPTGTFARIALEVKKSISPREARNIFTPFLQRMRDMASDIPILVAADWISPRTREVLQDQRINFVDLTGNSRISLDNPPLFIETEGADRNPRPKERGQAQLKGSKAGRLIRTLADVRPPYGVRQLADFAGLAPGYVSRMLDTLYQEALVERSPRGQVESVDVSGLLRRWAKTYDVFRANHAKTFIAPMGVDNLLARFNADPATGTRIAITGSFAAAQIAPVASSAMLLVYYDAPSLLADRFNLLPAESGADVALLQAFDTVVWQRTSIDRGLRYVAPTQMAVDCLTGNGRMPAEGEALLSWLEDNEDDWRAASISDLTKEKDERP